MVKIILNKKTNEWEKLPPYSKEGVYINEKLFHILQNIFMIIKKEWDCVFQIDGLEGSGKSIFGIFLAWVLSKETLTINNIAEDSNDAINKLESLPDKSVLVIDEGSLSFSSKEVMKKEQRKLVQILNVIRQKNMILIIISPSFFELNKYISVHRSRFLLHVYAGKKMQRGNFAYFSTKQKRLLYEIGKKNYNSYSKPRSKFTGRFVNWKPTFYDEYLQTKKKSLISSLKREMGGVKEWNEVDFIASKVQKAKECNPDITRETLSKAFGVSKRTISAYWARKLPKTPPVKG